MEGFVVSGEAEVWAVEGVGLPEVVGVGFGEGESAYHYRPLSIKLPFTKKGGCLH